MTTTAPRQEATSVSTTINIDDPDALADFRERRYNARKARIDAAGLNPARRRHYLDRTLITASDIADRIGNASPQRVYQMRSELVDRRSGKPRPAMRDPHPLVLPPPDYIAPEAGHPNYWEAGLISELFCQRCTHDLDLATGTLYQVAVSGTGGRPRASRIRATPRTTPRTTGGRPPTGRAGAA